MRQSLTSLFIIAILLVGITGCSNLSKPKGSFDLAPRRITIHTEPAGADVVQLRPLGQPATRLGSTPIADLTVTVMTNMKYENMPFNETQKLLKHANNAVVKITKEGYEPYIATISTKKNETSILDVKLIEKGK